MNKVFNERFNVGRSKYCISYHNGEKKHKDGSPFYDIALFNDGKKRDAFIQALLLVGYHAEN